MRENEGALHTLAPLGTGMRHLGAPRKSKWRARERLATHVAILQHWEKAQFSCATVPLARLTVANLLRNRWQNET